MKFKSMIVALMAGVLSVVMAGPALAHVTATPDEGAAGSFFTTYFKVGHGCEESPTTEVTMQIPDGVTNVAPEAIPGWSVETKIGELSEPVEVHGEEITEGVKEVTWTAQGEPLDAHQFLNFGLGMRLPDGDDGEVIYFPFVQSCEKGELAWVNIPDSLEEWGEIEEPAPYVVLTAAEGAHGGGSDEEMSDDAEGMSAMSEDDVRGIANEVLASSKGDAGSDSDTGVLLGGIGLGLGLIALIVAALAFRKSATR